MGYQQILSNTQIKLLGYYVLIKKNSIVFLALLFLSLFPQAYADPIIIDDSVSSINLGPHSQIYVDETHKTTIAEIVASGKNFPFNALHTENDIFNFQTGSYWFKVELENVQDDDLDRLLEFKPPLLDSLIIYVINNSSNSIIAKYNLGDLKPFRERPYPHSNFVVPITLPAHSDVTLYFRIQTSSSMLTGATLWQADAFYEQSRINFFWLSLSAGILLSLIIYTLLAYAATRNKGHLYYTLFAGSALLSLGAYTGLWFELLWPNSPYWHSISAPIGLSLSGTFLALFSRSLLHTESTSPKLDKIFYYLAIAFGLVSIVSLFISPRYTSLLLTLLAFVLYVTSLVTGIILTRRDDNVAKIYFLAWLILLVGGSSFLIAQNIGWLPDSTTTWYAIIFSGMLNAILLAYALNHRKEGGMSPVISHEDTKEFQERVGQRTQELTNMNEKLSRQEGVLKQLAFYDSLTGLANRTFVMEQLEFFLVQATRRKSKVAVLFLDLDSFKPINDRYGHKVGDEVLIITATRLRAALRDTDVVGRLGGDEFIILLDSDNADEFDPHQVADKIRATISEPILINELNLQVGTSIGIASYPENGRDAESLISAADYAMYIDKAYKEIRTQ